MPFDLHIQPLREDEALDTGKIVGFGYDPPIGIKGFQMLINIWMKIFLTRRGSDPTNLLRGTGFTNLIGSNATLSEAEDITRSSITQCNEQIAAIQRRDQTLTPHELLSEARLIEFSPLPALSGFRARVEILNQAGQRLGVVLPDILNAL